MSDRGATPTLQEPVADNDISELEHLLVTSIEPSSATAMAGGGVRVGKLVAFDKGTIPLVIYPGQPGTAALAARATVDLHASHIGREVVLVFDEGDLRRPIVIGCLQHAESRGLPQASGQVEIDTDGERLVASAKEQIVLRCGKASLTLTKAGKVIIEGAYVTNRATGVLRLRGGCVQIN